ncbi:MAG: hypothetical protein JO297_05935 [Nitrososphaeraceae archaeon]|nr:hypothetical protein [Nitrososphaeraceae archaeon]
MEKSYVMSIRFGLALAAILTTAAITSIANTSGGIVKNAYGQSDYWYVGKGLQPNTYYTYKIQTDVDNGQPFLMTIYFKEFNSAGQYWIAPAYVVNYKGEVITGTLNLSDLDLSVLGTSKVPDNMQPYLSAYTSSIHWLASFVPKPGQSLSSAYWGKIASIGGSPISPGGSAKVTVPAGTFDTKVITYHKGVDNNIWINPNLPFPVKAQTFADVTSGNPPIQYAFDLQATGQGQPTIPKSQLIIPKPPLTIQTARGTYYIQLLWDPQTISVGKATNFGVIFQDNSKNIQAGVSYSFKVTDSSGKVLSDVHDQNAQDGTGKQSGITFTKAGPANVLVSIDAVQGQPTGEFVENANFDVVVVA